MTQRIHLTIDRLALPHLAPSERDSALHALRLELARLLAQPGYSAGPSHQASALRLAPLPAGASRSGRALGTALARSIAGSLAAPAPRGGVRRP